jgi:hypothetical protein
LSHSTSSFFVLVFFKTGSLKLFCLGCLQNKILLVSASRVARIIGMSYQDLAKALLLLRQGIAMQSRLISNLWSSCISLICAEIIGMYHSLCLALIYLIFFCSSKFNITSLSVICIQIRGKKHLLQSTLS